MEYLRGAEIVRSRFFEWKRGLGIAQSLLLALIYACFTGLMAQTIFYLPWTPVPVTGQTFAVFLGAVLLGKWAVASQTIYTFLGIAGLPWFAGWKGGLAAIAGPTGGYLIGFIFASFFIGYFVEKHGWARRPVGLAALMIAADLFFVYGFGLAQLYLWQSFVAGSRVGTGYLFSTGFLPFVLGDAFKIAAAVIVAKAALSR